MTGLRRFLRAVDRNLFVMAGLTGQPIMSIAWRAVPFVVVMIFISFGVGFLPQLSLFLLR